MASRNDSGYVDVRVNGQVVGFVVIPSTPGGKWHAYVDAEGKNSTRVGSYNDKSAAVTAVENAGGS